MKLKLKICGMKHAANIAAVADLQPDYMGFICYEKSPRFISEISSELIKYVPPTIKTTGVFVNEKLEVVEAAIVKYKFKAIQLHGNEPPEYCASLRSYGVEVIKAFGIHDDFDFTTLVPYSNVVDYFLFDTQTVAHGGSGKVFDWNLIERYQLQKPYFLSGGIELGHAEKFKDMEDHRLYGVDLNSKFEIEPGMKDIEKLTRFIEILSA